MATKRLNLKIGEIDPEKFANIVSQCRKAGFRVENELELIGAVTGSVDEMRLEEIRAIPGVEAVEEDGGVQAF